MIEWLATPAEWAFRLLPALIGRPTLRIRILEDRDDTQVGGLSFEVENVGSRPTSLQPVIEVSYFNFRRVEERAFFDVRELDRELLPFKARLLSATGRGLSKLYGAGCLRSYIFRPTKGRPARAYVRGPFLQAMRPTRFWYERLRFKITGRLSDESPRGLREYEIMKRSRGPH
jgi:hypothetical protein